MREKGFTLVEILVVVAIIAIAVGMFLVSVGDGRRDKQVRADLRQISTILKLASEEALLQGKEIGVLVQPDTYSFYVFVFSDEGGYWQPYTEDRLLRERLLPEDLYMSLEVEGQNMTFEPNPNFIVPQIRMWSSGDLTPFIWQFEAEDGREVWEIWGYDNGAIEFIDVEEF